MKRAKSSRLGKVPLLTADIQMGSMQNIGKKYVVSAPKVMKRMKGILESGAARATGLNIVHFYAPKSRVMRSVEGMRAVKLSDGTKGWITDKGGFRTMHDVQMTMRSLDHTIFGQGLDYSLEETFLQASPKQQAEMARMLENVDWEKFWNNYYPEDTGRAADIMYPDEIFDRIVNTMQKIMFG